MGARRAYYPFNKYTLLGFDEEGKLLALGPRKARHTFIPVKSYKYRRCAQCGGRIDPGDPIWRSLSRQCFDRICDPCAQLVSGYRREYVGNPAEAHKPSEASLKRFPLLEHAYRELDVAGLFYTAHDEAEIGTCILGMIEILARHDLSASGSFDLVLKLFWDLAHRRPISQLTTDKTEWQDWSNLAGRPLWASIRDSEAFSEDGGETFYRSTDILKRRLKSLTRGEYRNGRNDEPQPEHHGNGTGDDASGPV